MGFGSGSGGGGDLAVGLKKGANERRHRKEISKICEASAGVSNKRAPTSGVPPRNDFSNHHIYYYNIIMIFEVVLVFLICLC